MNKEEEFADFQSFDNFETAQLVLLHTLEEHGIPYQLSDTKTEGDFIKGKVSWVHPVAVKIPLNCFEKTNRLLEEKADRNVFIPAQHYLYGFTNTELLEILEKPDEWSKEDYAISKKLLAERGQPVTEQDIVRLREQRLAALAKPETVEPVWIYAGFAAALAGGLPGIFLGRIFYSSKKTLPNGKKVFSYDKETRNNGYLVFITGIVALIIWMAFIILKLTSADWMFSSGHRWF